MPLFNSSILTGSQGGNFSVIQMGGLGDLSGSGVYGARYNPWNGSASPLVAEGSSDTGDNAILYDEANLFNSIIVNTSPSNTPGYLNVSSVVFPLKSAGTYRFTLIKQYSSYSNSGHNFIDGVGLISLTSTSVTSPAFSWLQEPVKLVLWETETANPSSGDPQPLTALESSNTVTLGADKNLYIVMRKDYLSYGGVYATGTARIKIEKL